MTTASPVEATVAALEAAGVDLVLGTAVNPAGLVQAKTVPVRRAAAFADPGLGASPVWHGFTIDGTGIAFTDRSGPVGDQRLRIDLSAARMLGDGLAWAPGSFFDQDGQPVPECGRGTLLRVEHDLSAAGLQALVGHELEFQLVRPDGDRLTSTVWAPYGLAGVLEHEAFVRDVMADLSSCGVVVEQLHPEFGTHQFEMAFAPLPPVASVDQLLLARTVVARVARRYGLQVSISPTPFAGGVGCGAHQHFSLSSGVGPLFSGGSGARGMTSAGESAISGVLRGLIEAQGVLCGSVVSGLRLRPGNWAGAYVCWGTENREAAIRFVLGGPANPCGSNVEVKCVDPSANPYLATATILGLALDGIRDAATLPAEVDVDPAALSETDRDRLGIATLSSSQKNSVAALDGSRRLRAILGDPAVDATVAVRAFEHERYGHLSDEHLTERFRLAWSV